MIKMPRKSQKLAKKPSFKKKNLYLFTEICSSKLTKISTVKVFSRSSAKLNWTSVITVWFDAHYMMTNKLSLYCIVMIDDTLTHP